MASQQLPSPCMGNLPSLVSAHRRCRTCWRHNQPYLLSTFHVPATRPRVRVRKSEPPPAAATGYSLSFDDGFDLGLVVTVIRLDVARRSSPLAGGAFFENVHLASPLDSVAARLTRATALGAILEDHRVVVVLVGETGMT